MQNKVVLRDEKIWGIDRQGKTFWDLNYDSQAKKAFSTFLLKKVGVLKVEVSSLTWNSRTNITSKKFWNFKQNSQEDRKK